MSDSASHRSHSADHLVARQSANQGGPSRRLKHGVALVAGACFLVAVTGVIGLSANGSALSSSSSQIASGPALPESLSVILNAQTVAVGTVIYVAYQHRTEGDEGVRIGFATHDGVGGWRTLESPPFPASEFSATVLGLDGSQPCIGASSAAGPIVSCFDGQAWSDPVTIDAKGWVFHSMESIGGRLYALTANLGSAHRVWVKSGNQFSAIPGSVKGMIGVLGEDASQPLINTEVSRRGVTKREIWRPSGSKWIKIGSSDHAGIGPQTRGSIGRGGSTYLSMTDADRMPWKFTVLKGAGRSWQQVTRKPLNLSRGGSAQGRLAIAAGKVWAVWQESTQRRDGSFDSLFAARLVSRPGAPKVLWRGRSVGPGDLDVIRVGDQTWAMYMPARSKRNPSLGIRFKRIA